jgi:signal peptidase I
MDKRSFVWIVESIQNGVFPAHAFPLFIAAKISACILFSPGNQDAAPAYSNAKRENRKMDEMNSKGRNKWLALVFGLIMPGLGQIYNGELIKGLSFFMIGLAATILGSRWTVLLSDRMLLLGALTTFLIAVCIYVSSIVDAYRKASQTEAVYQLKSYNQWYFYLAVWLLGFVISGSTLDYIKGNYLTAFIIPTGSMTPTVQPGDCILADRTANRRMPPKIGDLVIFYNPDDHSKRFIKRIVALPGAVIKDSNGNKIEVPHGSVYVMGDNRNNSIDSRAFGFLPLGNIIAKPRQIYFSSGKDGIRWNRIGKPIE